MAESTPRKALHVERTQLGTYRAISTSGATLDFGRGEGLLTPVELLLAGIAGCSAIDVDYVTVKRSEPTSFIVEITALPVTDENGGHRLDDIVADFHLSFPDTPEGKAAADVVDRTLVQSHERLCTVSRTVSHPTNVTFIRDGKPVD